MATSVVSRPSLWEKARFYSGLDHARTMREEVTASQTILEKMRQLSTDSPTRLSVSQVLARFEEADQCWDRMTKIKERSFGSIDFLLRETRKLSPLAQKVCSFVQRLFIWILERGDTLSNNYDAMSRLLVTVREGFTVAETSFEGQPVVVQLKKPIYNIDLFPRNSTSPLLIDLRPKQALAPSLGSIKLCEHEKNSSLVLGFLSRGEIPSLERTRVLVQLALEAIGPLGNLVLSLSPFIPELATLGFRQSRDNLYHTRELVGNLGKGGEPNFLTIEETPVGNTTWGAVLSKNRILPREPV